MDKQTQQAFALGGLNDEGGEIDEASGNRVPIGGTKEGVRDDIEINISEGEFVFPADVVRYHGLDKMMALRQEAKMGLKQMERMGQMGNSDEATMPDDLPFEMADLIVVGGKGEPMEFSEGGFVPSYTPKFETLEIADVPMMGGNTSTGTQTPLVYEDFMKTPVVTMQEYRDANGNSIIITYVNGVATTEIPEGYTLYTPPANTAPTTTQAAIQTVNRRSYRPTTGDNEGPEPQPDQPAPDYKNMNDDEFFSYMAEQNGFGAKAGNAAGLAIATMIGGPVGLLVGALMRNDKNNQMANMKSRIDRMDNGPAKTNALALYKEYGGETDPKKKQGLFANIANFVTGLVTPVANTLGINQEDAAKVAQNAAVTEVSGAGPAIESATSAAPTTSLKPVLRPDVSTTAPVTQTGPQGTAIGAFTNTDPRRAIPTGRGINMTVEKPPSVPAAQIPYTTTAPISVPSSTPDPVIPEATPATGQVPLAQAGVLDDMIARAPDRTSVFKTSKPAVQVAGPISTAIPTAAAQTSVPDVVPESPDATRRYGPDELSYIDDNTYRDTKRSGANADYNLQQPQTLVEQGQQAAYNARRANERAQAAIQPFISSPFTDVAATDDSMGLPTGPLPDDPRDPYAGDIVTRDVRTDLGAGTPSFIEGVSTAPIITETDDGQKFSSRISQTYDPQTAGIIGTDSVPSQTQQAFSVPTAGTGGYDELPSMGSTMGPLDIRRGVAPVTSMAGIEPYNPSVEPRSRSMYEYPVQETAPKETAAQARAREAAAQRARIQTRNKEIATATSKIPAYIANSKQTQDSIKAGYVGSTTGGYAIGKISGSDGNEAGVVQRADGKVTKVRDLEGYEGLAGTQRGAMTVFSDAEGTKFVKSTFGKKTKLNGDEYTGPGITQADKGGAAATATAQQITKNNVRYNVKDETRDSSGGGESYSAPADPPGNTGGFTSITDMFDGGGPGESAEEERKRGGGDGGSSRVICTELYKQGKLDRELYRMDVVYTAKHLSPITVRGYHYWAVPMVVKMRSSTLLTNVFEYLTIARAKEIAHIVKPQEYKKRSILGYFIKNVSEAICYSIGLFTDQKDWTVLYNKGIVK